MSADLYAQLEKLGIDKARIETVIRSENWGRAVHSFEILTVLGVVADGWPDVIESDEEDSGRAESEEGQWTAWEIIGGEH